MTKQEALEMLKNAPTGNESSAINQLITMTQAVDIVTKGIKALRINDNDEIDEIFEKRVCQVYRNQSRPKYYPCAHSGDE